MVIWKFNLLLTDRQTVTMPKGAQILSVKEQFNELQMWAIVEPDAVRETRLFEIIGTGHPMADVAPECLERIHLESLVTTSGYLVWHVFELKTCGRCIEMR